MPLRGSAAAAEIVGGSGGGRPDMAQAGGKHPDKLAAALETGPRISRKCSKEREEQALEC